MPPETFIVDEAACAEADAALAALAAEYPAYAQADVDEMSRLSARLAGHFASGEDMAGDLAALHEVAHNVKGQGAYFGYELMTLIGDAVCRNTRDRTVLDGIQLASTSALVAACRDVLATRLTGWGGADGSRLMAELGLQQA